VEVCGKFLKTGNGCSAGMHEVPLVDVPVPVRFSSTP
jgi:hypothetical protein